MLLLLNYTSRQLDSAMNFLSVGPFQTFLDLAMMSLAEGRTESAIKPNCMKGSYSPMMSLAKGEVRIWICYL